MSLLSILKDYLITTVALIAIAAIYTALVFTQSQNFTVAKKDRTVKESTAEVTPARDVASPLETE